MRKRPSVKIQLPNIFNNHHFIAKPKPTIADDKWPLFLALWIKFYNSHGIYKPESNKYFLMYQCQLNFAMFCATSALGISWQNLNHPNLLVRSVYRFHVYFHERLKLHELGISLPHEDDFSKDKNVYIKSAYYSICDDYGVDADETWMYRDWFYTTEVKATERSPPDNLTRWIITRFKALTIKGTEQISRSVRAYVYLVLTSQAQARSSIVGNSAPAVDAQKVFKSTFKALINEDYSIGIDIERYQGVLEHALSKVDFSVGIGIYMLASNLNLSIGKTKGYNNKILVSNTDMKIGSNRDINRDHKNLTPPNVPKKIVIPAVQHKPPHNLKMLTEKHNDEKLAITLLIVGTGLIAYHFW